MTKNQTDLQQEINIKNLQYSLQFYGLNVHIHNLELILKVNEKIQEKSDQITIKDLSKIKSEIETKYKRKLSVGERTLEFLNCTIDKRLKTALEIYYKDKFENIKMKDILTTSVSNFSLAKNVGYQTLQKFEHLKKFISNEY